MTVVSSYEILDTDTHTITQVKRLVDGKVFTVGDVTHYGKILKFQIEKNRVLVSTGSPSLYGIREVRCYALQYLDFL